MNAYILILTVMWGGNLASFPRGAAITSIGGFVSKAACLEGAAAWGNAVSKLDSNLRFSAVCVPTSGTPKASVAK